MLLSVLIYLFIYSTICHKLQLKFFKNFLNSLKIVICFNFVILFPYIFEYPITPIWVKIFQKSFQMLLLICLSTKRGSFTHQRLQLKF